MAGVKQLMKLFMKNGRNKRAFSIIELVITIGIIAALVGIATPYYQDYVGQGKNSVMRSNLHMLRKVLMDYKSDKGAYPTELKLIAPTYVMEVPFDPEVGAPASWGYTCSSPFTSYTFDNKYNNL